MIPFASQYGSQLGVASGLEAEGGEELDNTL
jgi:hypothetical protein